MRDSHGRELVTIPELERCTLVELDKVLLSLIDNSSILDGDESSLSPLLDPRLGVVLVSSAREKAVHRTRVQSILVQGCRAGSTRVVDLHEDG